MYEKPTYEELEKRIQEIEKSESDLKQAEEKSRQYEWIIEKETPLENTKDPAPKIAAITNNHSIPIFSQMTPPAIAIAMLTRWLIEIPVERVEVSSSRPSASDFT